MFGEIPENIKIITAHFYEEYKSLYISYRSV